MILDYFKLAFKNLRARKLRSWLTMLGIFIGIAAVVSLISLGQGLQDYIAEEFEQLGSDKIIIQPKTLGPPGSATSESLILTSKDLDIVKDVRGVKWAVGFLVKQGQATFRDELGIGFASGSSYKDEKFLNELDFFKIIEGRQLKKGDKFKVVVGYNHAYDDIWEKPVKIGNTIQIENQDFKVIGIVEKIGNPIDDAILHIPKETLRELLDVKDEESQILVRTEKGFNPEEVADSIERKLRRSRGEKEDQETFNVQTSSELLNSFQTIFAVVQGILVGIAAISLLVGGVGIMNTMYTAVLERTKEIGIMKAIGAKNSDVLLLFLLESGILGLVGGIIGVFIGIGLSKTVEIIAAQALGSPLIQASFPISLLIGALAFSFITGSLSGVFPAIQASKLKPVDALRHE
ncbi:ABC transporter permease [archaeon]|nr:ABC transporter permease [archaeon]